MTNQNIKDEDAINSELESLLDKATNLNEELELQSKDTLEKLDGMEKEIKGTVGEIRDGLVELDKDEEETIEEMQKLMMEESEELAEEDEEEN